MVTHSYSEFIADVVYISLELVIAILAIAGNVLVCWAVCLNSNLQNVTNYFVASLAVADVAVGVLAIPFAIAISTGFCASFHICLFIACFVLVLTQSSIFSLLAIAIDRIIAIRMPLRYNALVTGSRAKGIIAICWVLSFIIGLTPMLGWHQHPTGAEKGTDKNGSSSFSPLYNNCSDNMMPCLFEKVVTMEYMVYYNFFACVLIPLLLMFGIYLKIFMAARRQLKQIGNKMAHGERSCSILQKEVHAAKSLAIIVGLFAICWLPLHINNCYILFCQGCGRPPLWLMYVAILLSHANSVVNPLIYAYRIREFRHTFRKIIGQHVLCRMARLRPTSQKHSLHGGENGEHTSIRVGEYGLNFFSNGDETDDVHADSDLSTEWHQEMNGLDGEANGHIGRHCYRNGDISGAAKKGEQVSQELLGRHESYTELETSAFDGSSVS